MSCGFSVGLFNEGCPNLWRTVGHFRSKQFESTSLGGEGSEKFIVRFGEDYGLVGLGMPQRKQLEKRT